MVTRIVLVEEAEIQADRTMVSLPSARRMMKATLIGTIDADTFRQGISSFPVLDSPVLLASKDDLDTVFGPISLEDATSGDPTLPGYCITVGESTIVRGRPVRIDPDAFFGKHAAILGSTGSGKSCTIASILQSIHKQPKVNRTTCVILDTNGEYRSAFTQTSDSSAQPGKGPANFLYIPSDPSNPIERLTIPYWFMDSEDYIRLFRAREGLQAPVLLRGLRLAKSQVSGDVDVQTELEILRIACEQILAVTLNTSPTQQWALPSNIRKLCDDGLRYSNEFPDARDRLSRFCGEDVLPRFEEALRTIREIARQAESRRENGDDQGLGVTRIQQIRRELDPIIDILVKSEDPISDVSISVDQPVYFQRNRFLEESLRTAMREQAESGNPGRIRDACGPMLLRIRRFFEDPRFGFIFNQYANVENGLATFLRDILGLGASPNASETLTKEEEVPKSHLPFYDRQRDEAKPSDVVIIDLSLLAAEVLENVTAIIGRLILEFLQRLGEHGGDKDRGSLPVVLVLEEAQNYIQQQRSGDEESISKVVFERIAREGRKYGLSLVVASQRPSELSKTVLSQCNSFVVHRLQNPEDLRYFKEIVPGIYGPMLDQIPALAPQTALILGECVPAPVLAKIREARPIPRSRDPLFYQYWTQSDSPVVPVEEVCAKWEGKNQSLNHTPSESNQDKGI